MSTRWGPHLRVALAATAALLLSAWATAVEQIAWAGADGTPTTSAPENELMAAPSPPPPSELGAGCDLASAVSVATIALGEGGAVPACAVVGAGDLVTWMNRTEDPITIQSEGDEFTDADVSGAFSSFEVPAQGAAVVRLIHAGQVAYASPDDPDIAGTILVLGRG